MTVDIKREKEYLNRIQEKIRSFEMEKVKLEQQKIYNDKAIAETTKAMKELGFTPETIEDGIRSLESDISVMKEKIDKAMNSVAPTGTGEENESGIIL